VNCNRQGLKNSFFFQVVKVARFAWGSAEAVGFVLLVREKAAGRAQAYRKSPKYVLRFAKLLTAQFSS